MPNEENTLVSILNANPLLFAEIMANKDSFHVQVIYTKIDRDKNNLPCFTDYTFNLNHNFYFYPASTVKMPIAFLALQKLNESNIDGVTKFTKMSIGDTNHLNVTPHKQLESISDYIKKIFLVSDNDAFNKLYDFLGQDYIKNSLGEKGYPTAEIRHRLELNLSPEQNRQTGPAIFFNDKNLFTYKQPANTSKAVFSKRNDFMGKGFYKNDSLVMQPFDFSFKNRIHLDDLHHILRSVIFPEAVSESRRFKFTQGDYQFIYRYMSAYPYETTNPVYDTTEFYDTYVKFLLYGSEKGKVMPGVRIFNKVGDAYGFLTDVAYIADFKNKTEFFLSATIYCNRDGILNDDKYDYETIGYPFMKNLGQKIYEYEMQRVKKFLPNFNKFILDYNLP